MRATAGLAVAVVFIAGCRSTPRIEPAVTGPVPGEVRPVVVREGTPVAGHAGHTEADTRFMQHMIGHHAQALDMTKLVPTRTKREDMRLLAERIDVSQRDEIAQMRQWLAQRSEQQPPPDAHHHAAMGHGPRMPGMLTAAELEELAQATGTEFERLWEVLTDHEGMSDWIGARVSVVAGPADGRISALFRRVCCRRGGTAAFGRDSSWGACVTGA
jgi:uncharacterized protein (DUF305 family)